MKKRVLAILLMLCMLLALTSCGGSNGTSAPEASAENPGSSDASGTSAPAPEVSWPDNKTITVIVPYGAGGDTDFNARIIFEKVQEKLGGNFIVQNISGNSGAVGAQTALDAAPDGNTFLFYHTAMLINEATGLTPFGYRDFDMVCIAANKDNGCFFMRADNKYGIKSYDDLKAYTQAHPGELVITYQAGGTSHLGTMLMVDSGVDCTMVDIGGKSEQLAALLGNQIDIAALTYASAKEYVDSGEFITIGYFGPENPLVDKEKYPALVNYGLDNDWAMNYSVLAPKGTDPAIIKILSDAIADIIANDEDYASRIAEAYYQVPTYYNSEDAVKTYGEQMELLQPYVEALKG